MPKSSKTFTIAFLRNNTRRPAAIPLHSISNRAERTASSTSQGPEKPHSSDLESADSDFSSWSDTGDLGDQLADEEDPLSLRLQETLQEASFTRSTSRRQKRVHHRRKTNESLVGERSKEHAGFAKEDIEIPNPRPRAISRFEHLLAAIMSGGERQLHGLTGRPLV